MDPLKDIEDKISKTSLEDDPEKIVDSLEILLNYLGDTILDIFKKSNKNESNS